MKKSVRKLFIASIALVATLALTITSTFAWFNMNEKVSASFDVTITSDSGFQIAVRPFVYAYNSDSEVYTVTEPEDNDDYATFVYKQVISKEDFEDLFTKNKLYPATVDRDSYDDFDESLAFIDAEKKPLQGEDGAVKIIPELSGNGVWKVPFIKFRVYFISTVERDIYIDSSTITKAEGSLNVSEIKIEDKALFEKLVLGTIDADKWNDSSNFESDNTTYLLKDPRFGGGKLENILITPGGDDDDDTIEYTLTDVKLVAVHNLLDEEGDIVEDDDDNPILVDGFTNAFRVAYDGIANEEAVRYIYDKNGENSDSEKVVDDPLQNFGWIYYKHNAGLGNYELPITTTGDTKDAIVSLTLEAASENSIAYSYGFVDMTIWLEGYDEDCFDSIIGTAVNYNFGFTSVQPN